MLQVLNLICYCFYVSSPPPPAPLRRLLLAIPRVPQALVSTKFGGGGYRPKLPHPANTALFSSAGSQTWAFYTTQCNNHSYSIDCASILFSRGNFKAQRTTTQVLCKYCIVVFLLKKKNRLCSSFCPQTCDPPASAS